MKKPLIVGGAVVALSVVVWLMWPHPPAERDGQAVEAESAEQPDSEIDPNAAEDQQSDESTADESEKDEEDAEEAPEPMTEEEKQEAEAEKRVDEFDDLTDKWTEPSSKGVTMSDVDHFAKTFRQVPKDRQDECIHRALNLIPDENVMLLAGVLMDKGMDKEIVETVYNDVLNRDEEVKKPILQQIFKDKSHPCWADTAWILDVTGDLPKKE